MAAVNAADVDGWYGVPPVADATATSPSGHPEGPVVVAPLRHEYWWPLKGSPALVVALPLPVLFEKDGAPAVWVFDPQSGSSMLKPVTVARYDADTAVIASGLAKGDTVITAGINTLREGQKVRLANAAPGGSTEQ